MQNKVSERMADHSSMMSYLLQTLGNLHKYSVSLEEALQDDPNDVALRVLIEHHFNTIAKLENAIAFCLRQKKELFLSQNKENTIK